MKPKIAPGIERLLGHSKIALVEGKGELGSDGDLANLALGYGHVGLGVDDLDFVQVIDDVTRHAGHERIV